jgi:hypothetical protein
LENRRALCKTGTFSDVLTLAGYANTQAGRLRFVIPLRNVRFATGYSWPSSPGFSRRRALARWMSALNH